MNPQTASGPRERRPPTFWPWLFDHVETVVATLYAGTLAVTLGAVAFGGLLPKGVYPPIGLVFLGIAATGAPVYVFYRYVLGEFVLYPVRHLLHDGWCAVAEHRVYLELLATSPASKADAHYRYRSFTRLIRALLRCRGESAGLWRAREIYNLFRHSDQILGIERREALSTRHGLYHLLYLTAIELSIFATLAPSAVAVERGWLWSVAGAALISAFFVDLRQDTEEAREIQYRHLGRMHAVLDELYPPARALERCDRVCPHRYSARPRFSACERLARAQPKKDATSTVEPSSVAC